MQALRGGGGSAGRKPVSPPRWGVGGVEKASEPSEVRGEGVGEAGERRRWAVLTGKR